ncbi:TfpX/TfpZ family type IV pilin accessory protein [Comamonas sp. MYb396]|uniref:TfpX/TfpZ family type IV pilin accessory protein n=1 Tax=Comamonas sp. MYb396 TaxID=2745302 RepID=UPI00309ECB64
MREKFKAAGIHFLVGLVLLSAVFCLIYFVWYPAPFYRLSGGQDLMELIFGVDLILGPLLTWVVFNKKKPLRTNLWDVAVIACVQLAALGYGIYTVLQARPVFVGFEYDRFRVVHANEPDPKELLKARAVIQRGLPLSGPKLLGLRKPTDPVEKLNSTMLALGGVSEAAQANLWVPYEQVQSEVLAQAHPVQRLIDRFPTQADKIRQLLADHQLALDNAVYVPLIVKDAFWTVVLDKHQLDKPYYLDIDSFEN